MVDQATTRKPGAPFAKRMLTILPLAWEATEWTPELISRPLARNDHPRSTDREFMNDSNPKLPVRRFDPDPAVVYSIDTVERLAQTPRRAILRYCRHGLVSTVTDPEFGGYYFNREAILVLRRIGYLHTARGVNLAGIKFILELTEEIRQLRSTSAG